MFKPSAKSIAGKANCGTAKHPPQFPQFRQRCGFPQFSPSTADAFRSKTRISASGAELRELRDCTPKGVCAAPQFAAAPPPWGLSPGWPDINTQNGDRIMPDDSTPTLDNDRPCDDCIAALRHLERDATPHGVVFSHCSHNEVGVIATFDHGHLVKKQAYVGVTEADWAATHDDLSLAMGGGGAGH